MMFTDLDEIMLSEDERKLIDDRWLGSGIKGRKPNSYLNRLKKLYEHGINLNGCHSIPNYGQFNSAIDLCTDTEAYREAHDEWLTMRRHDNLNGTLTYEEIVHDSDGSLWLTLCRKSLSKKLEVIRAARQEGHETSLSHRQFKSRLASRMLIKNYLETNPNQHELRVHKVADWAIRTNICPPDKKSRRNLTVRLRRYLSSNEARLLKK